MINKKANKQTRPKEKEFDSKKKKKKKKQNKKQKIIKGWMEFWST